MRVFVSVSIIVTAVLGSSVISSAQPDQCPTIIETALSAADEFCSSVGRNQACYGHIAVSAQPRETAAEFIFEDTGDTVNVNAIQLIQLSPLDVDNGFWGLVIMSVQANLPDTLPGQNVTLVAFGDTEITNLAEVSNPLPTIISTGGSNLNLRIAPSPESPVLRSIPDGSMVSSIGRSQNNEWLLVQLPETGEKGWIISGAASIEGGLDLLPVVETDQPIYGPMQAFRLETGFTGAARCGELPESGLLVQTPEGALTVELTINGVDIEFGSTMYITADPDEPMNIRMIEGGGRVSANGDTRPLPAGGQVSVELDDDFMPVGVPSSYAPYDDEDIDDLPLQALDREIEAAEPVDPEIAAQVAEFEAYFEQIGIENFDEMIDLLEAQGDSAFSESEMTDFLEELGYEVGEDDFGFFEDETPLDEVEFEEDSLPDTEEMSADTFDDFGDEGDELSDTSEDSSLNDDGSELSDGGDDSGGDSGSSGDDSGDDSGGDSGSSGDDSGDDGGGDDGGDDGDDGGGDEGDD